jgi:transcription antitermination factor NusG
MHMATGSFPYLEQGVDFEWCAIHTRHQHEKAVTHVLSNKGFETFLPLYDEVRRWKNRINIVSLPLFPCYVFARGVVRRLLSVQTTPGVHGVVSSAGRPLPIPANEIEAIRRAIESGTSLQPHRLLKRGDLVRVKTGALEGVSGILVRHKNVCRVVLSVQMLGKAAAVEVDAMTLERVKKDHAGKLDVSRVTSAVRSGIDAEHSMVAF